MNYDEWAKENDIYGFLIQYTESKKAWDAAIEEAVKAVNVENSEFPNSLVQQVVILIEGLKE